MTNLDFSNDKNEKRKELEYLVSSYESSDFEEQVMKNIEETTGSSKVTGSSKEKSSTLATYHHKNGFIRETSILIH
jgi:hypothetical protein